MTVSDDDALAAEFEEHRTRLRGVAYRMLGSVHEADDAVQETWLRLHRTDGIDHLGGWLTTVVSRVCLDMLRSRASRREDGLAEHDTRSEEDGERIPVGLGVYYFEERQGARAEVRP